MTTFPNTLHISVTQHDIDNGSPSDAFRCPIARSLQRRFPEAIIQVALYHVLISSVIYDLPYRAMDFIVRFDHDLNVRPSRFTIHRHHV